MLRRLTLVLAVAAFAAPNLTAQHPTLNDCRAKLNAIQKDCSVKMSQAYNHFCAQARMLLKKGNKNAAHAVIAGGCAKINGLANACTAQIRGLCKKCSKFLTGKALFIWQAECKRAEAVIQKLARTYCELLRRCLGKPRPRM